MRKIDTIQEGKKTPKVVYEVYCKLFGKNLIKLNLTICANTKISISFPIDLPEDIDKYNSTSGYYNDICYTTTSEDGTDISLKDRQSGYANDENKLVCQEDCQLSKYDTQTHMAICSCNAKEAPSLVDVDFDKIDKIKLLKNFKDITNFLNYKFLICYKKLLNKKSIMKNIGSYIILAVMLFHLIDNFIFCSNQYRLIKRRIKNLVLGVYKFQNFSKQKTTNKQNNDKDKDKSKKILLKKEELLINIKCNKKQVTSNIRRRKISMRKEIRRQTKSKKI